MSVESGKLGRRSAGVWITLLLLLGGVILVWALLRRDPIESPVVQQPVPQTAEMPRSIGAGTIAQDEPAPVAPVDCPGQRIELTVDERKQTACVGETGILQNGSVRVYTVETTRGPRRWLRIEATGSTVLSVALGTGPGPEFQCRGSDCKDVSIGRHDAAGVRTISMDETALARVHPGDGPASPDSTARVSGKLRTVPEDRLPGLACVDQGVSIITSDGSSISFCPKGGAGFEIGDDGNRTYRFTSLDGESILVAVDRHHRVRQVEYHGAFRFDCGASDCGVRVSAPRADGERVFTFAGTALLETSRADRNAIVNGRLILPPL